MRSPRPARTRTYESPTYAPSGAQAAASQWAASASSSGPTESRTSASAMFVKTAVMTREIEVVDSAG